MVTASSTAVHLPNTVLDDVRGGVTISLCRVSTQELVGLQPPLAAFACASLVTAQIKLTQD